MGSFLALTTGPVPEPSKVPPRKIKKSKVKGGTSKISLYKGHVQSKSTGKRESY